jgi:asparagine synthase (glutamine-hydrolysing)
MCGIAGLSLVTKNKSLVKRFLNIKKSLFHRGPDGSGFYKKKNISLIHTRLSIVDLKQGYQPIKNKNLILIANGEIYNDLQIRKKYSNYKFITNSDSESILAVYKAKGIDGFKDLRGMYAFAIYDEEKHEIIISRDEFGIKPLYFALFNHGLIFCSELNSLRNAMPFKSSLNNQKVVEQLQFQYCTGNKTIYKGLNRLRPGETLIIQNGRIKESRFRKLDVKRNVSINESFFKRKIIETVKTHLRSDVPYCLFLSGGIDSMLLLYCIMELKLKNITAFTMNVSTKQDHSFKQICLDNNIKLKELSFSENDFWDLIFLAAEKIDEPVADYAILPTLKLSKKASKEFKVVLTGEGGDELFGGYGRYKKVQRFLFKGRDLKETFNSGTFFKKLQKKNNDFKNKTQYFDFKNTTKLQQKQLFDYKNWLPNDLLIKLDRCLMAFSLEGRTPFIDKNMFSNFFFVDDNLKIKSGFGKFYVRQFLKRNLKKYNSFSPKKGFTIPINEWIPKKIDLLKKNLLKLDFLLLFFTEKEIIFLCDEVKNDKKLSKSIWHIIFFSSWYLIHIEGIKERGNYFEVLKKVNEYKK